MHRRPMPKSHLSGGTEMGGRPGTRSQALIAPTVPQSIAWWMRQYMEALTLKHLNLINLRARRSNLGWFNTWCVERGLDWPAQIKHAHLLQFQRHLFDARKPDGSAYAINGQRSVLDNVQAWCRWLVRHGHLPSNPAAANACS